MSEPQAAGEYRPLVLNIIWAQIAFQILPQTIQTEPTNDSAIPLMSIYPKGLKLVSQRGIWTPITKEKSELPIPL